jgi:2-polyprenyl-3-methyl-5-hydroxy-6-metoxy-1,4-benzoquinol methylase
MSNANYSPYLNTQFRAVNLMASANTQGNNSTANSLPSSSFTGSNIQAKFDKTRAEAFAGKMLDILNGGTASLMISIGHQTRLFDVISKLPPSTSEEIAQSANLNERYVREWLGAMVTANIVDYDPSKQKYRLPAEHAAFLTREAGLNNIAVFTQYIALMGEVEQKIIECFHKGGGVPYSAYPRFQELQAEETARIFDARLVNNIIPLVDDIADRLNSGVDVLDVGCGRGRAINIMARAYPKSNFVGYDISTEGIESARHEAKVWNLTNASFEIKDVTTLNELEKYDLITAFDTIHDQAQPTKVLKEIYNALRKGGVFLMQDIAASSYLHENMNNPLAPTLYTFSTMHCMTVSLAYNGEGLGTVWGKQKAEQKLRDAGFSGPIEVKQIEGDILNYYYIARK